MSLPDQIKTFVASLENLKRRKELMRRFSVPVQAVSIFTKTINRLLDKEIGLAELNDIIIKETSLPADTVKQILLEFAGYEFLPISDYVGDVEAYIRSLGGDPNKYPTTKITVREITPSEVVTEVLHENPVNVPAFLEHRLREILESRVRNVRKDDETVQRLTRAEKIGGAEMEESEAHELVEKLVQKISGIKIAADNTPLPTLSPLGARGETGEAPALEDAAPVEQVATNIPVSAPRAVPAASAAAMPASSRKGDTFTPADEHEADVIRARVLPNMMTSSLFDLGKEIANATDLIATAYGKSLTPELAVRLRAVVSSRLKGVRDQAETLDLLSRGAENGGVGLGPVLADALMIELNKYDREIHGRREDVSKKEKEDFVKGAVASTFAKDESRKAGQQEELDRMYSALTGNKKKRQAAPPVTPPTPSYPKRGEEMPAAQPVVPVPPAPTAQSPYLYSPAPMQPLSQQAGGRMRDIRPMPVTSRLTGPVEELRNMTLTDFRRLSTDPVEACRKVIDKLDLLEERSFGQRIEGVKAWRESEIYKLYLQIITVSFSGGQQIPAIISAAMAANQPTLTEREVHAIMDMNRQLKA